MENTINTMTITLDEYNKLQDKITSLNAVITDKDELVKLSNIKNANSTFAQIHNNFE